MKNILSFDVEDYYQIVYRDMMHRETKPSKKVVEDTERILNILKGNDVRATFFILGNVAMTYPGLVKRIAGDGHEIATHGFSHRPVTSLTPEEFRRELDSSVNILEDITGNKVLGYRAPFFSLSMDTLWTLEILREKGLLYDSSMLNVQSSKFKAQSSMSNVFKFNVERRTSNVEHNNIPFLIGDNFWEFPLSTLKLFGKRIPVGGGGYFRLFPYVFTWKAIRKINQQGNPAVVYVHPHEIEFPWEGFKFDGISVKTKGKVILFNFRQRMGRKGMLRKIDKVLKDFRFCPIKDFLLMCDAGLEPATFTV